VLDLLSLGWALNNSSTFDMHAIIAKSKLKPKIECTDWLNLNLLRGLQELRTYYLPKNAYEMATV
jgi:hypothetical protein